MDVGQAQGQPPLADWEVHLTTGSSVTVAQAWHGRTKGDYVFHDEQGVCYTFPVFAVSYIRRVPGFITFGDGHLSPGEIQDLRERFSEAAR